MLAAPAQQYESHLGWAEFDLDRPPYAPTRQQVGSKSLLHGGTEIEAESLASGGVIGCLLPLRAGW